MASQIEISERWIHRVRSPLFYVVAFCTGISQSFCLYGLYQCGKYGYPLYHPFVLGNLAVIWLVFWFNTGISAQVIQQIRQPNIDRSAHDLTGNP